MKWKQNKKTKDKKLTYMFEMARSILLICDYQSPWKNLSQGISFILAKWYQNQKSNKASLLLLLLGT